MTTSTISATCASAKFAIGDYARSIETGWLGRVQMRCTDGFCKLVGIDFLCLVITRNIPDSICEDDVQYFDENDLEKVVFKRIVD